MIDWFFSLSPEHQVGLLTIVLTIIGGVALRGKFPGLELTHRPREPEERGFTEVDRNTLGRIETTVRTMRDTQIEIVTLLRSNNTKG